MNAGFSLIFVVLNKQVYLVLKHSSYANQNILHLTELYFVTFIFVVSIEIPLGSNGSCLFGCAVSVERLGCEDDLNLPSASVL